MKFIPAKTKKLKVTKDKVMKPAPKLNTFEVCVFPEPFKVKLLAVDVESAMEQAVEKFKAKHPTLTMSGVNVQQK